MSEENQKSYKTEAYVARCSYWDLYMILFLALTIKEKNELSERVIVEEKLGKPQCSRYLKN